jgi:uncharacterized protein YecE (DUF72 family)
MRPILAERGAAAALVGCAGWALPREAAARFPADGSHLERYAARLNAVEINSSFYKPHRAATYARWAASVPADFRFAVKLPRAITHHARLVDADELIKAFAGQAGALEGKLGCVLVQLPPSLAFDALVAGAFFDALQPRFACMLAVEARQASWFGAAATALLRERSITRVQADPPAGQPGPFEATTANRYLRLHGNPKVYYSSYDQAYIDGVAAELADKRAERPDSGPDWCIFDNTAAGCATPNALALTEALARPGAATQCNK